MKYVSKFTDICCFTAMFEGILEKEEGEKCKIMLLLWAQVTFVGY